MGEQEDPTAQAAPKPCQACSACKWCTCRACRAQAMMSPIHAAIANSPWGGSGEGQETKDSETGPGPALEKMLGFPSEPLASPRHPGEGRLGPQASPGQRNPKPSGQQPVAAQCPGSRLAQRCPMQPQPQPQHRPSH